MCDREMYEVHTTQEGTGVYPGDTFNLDYSVSLAHFWKISQR